MNIFKKIRLSRLFSIIIILLTSIIFICFVFSILLTVRYEKKTLELVSVTEGLHKTNYLKSNLRKLQENLVNAHDVSKETFNIQRKSIRKNIQESFPLHVTKDTLEMNLIRKLDSVLLKSILITDPFYKSDTLDPEIITESLKNINRAIVIASKLIRQQLNHAKNIQDETLREVKKAYVTTAIVAGVVTGIVIIILIFIRKFIYNPVLELRRSIRRFNGYSPMPETSISGPKEMLEIESSVRKLTERIISQQQAQHRFLLTIAHDIRNPLSGIQAASELLMNNYDGKSEELKGFTVIINNQVKQLNILVEGLMTTLKTEGGRIELDKKSNNMVQILKDSVDLYKLTTYKHKFSVSFPSRPVICNVDKARINEVFNNILSNAIKYSPDGGIIFVELEVSDKQVKITVADEGIGVDESELEKIFEPFRRTEQAQHSGEGEGLGLFVSRKIIQAHGGSIVAEKGEEKGTKIVITLPHVAS